MRQVLLLSLALLLAGPASAQSASDHLEAKLAEIRAESWEERWRLIPWRDSLEGALAEGRESGRPVFYFGADGDLDTGNC